MSFTTIAQTTNQGITNARSYLDNKANTILRPKDVKGIAGFLFDIEDSSTLSLEWDITDHYTESNSFLNDHKVKKPIVITLTGFIGELVFTAPSGVEGLLQSISNRLESVEAYLGDYTPGSVQEIQKVTQQAESAVSAINQTLDKAQNIIGFFEGEGSEVSAQQKAFEQLSALGDEVLLSVQTPWRFFDDMTIIALSLTQGGESDQITDISVTLKQLRISGTKIVDFDKDQFPIREKVQSAPTEDQGTIRGTESNTSLLFNAFGQ